MLNGVLNPDKLSLFLRAASAARRGPLARTKAGLLNSQDVNTSVLCPLRKNTVNPSSTKLAPCRGGGRRGLLDPSRKVCEKLNVCLCVIDFFLFSHSGQSGGGISCWLLCTETLELRRARSRCEPPRQKASLQGRGARRGAGGGAGKTGSR